MAYKPQGSRASSVGESSRARFDKQMLRRGQEKMEQKNIKMQKETLKALQETSKPSIKGLAGTIHRGKGWATRKQIENDMRNWTVDRGIKERVKTEIDKVLEQRKKHLGGRRERASYDDLNDVFTRLDKQKNDVVKHHHIETIRRQSGIVKKAA